jgi:hypothetical protein
MAQLSAALSTRKDNSTRPSVVKKSTVVAAPQQPPKKAKAGANNSSKSVMVKTSRDPQLDSYAASLLDPFSTLALGAQVPDMYSFPTATYHAEGTLSFGNSSTAGLASWLILPHPTITALDTLGTVSTNMTTNLQSYTTATGVYAAVTAPNLYAALSNFRVVGMGIQIRNLMAVTAATGRIIIAPIPIAGPIPGPGLLATAGGGGPVGSQIAQNCTGVGAFNGNLLDLPGSVEFAIQDIMVQGVESHFVPITPNAFNFHAAANTSQVGSDYQIGGEYQTGGAIATTALDASPYEDATGWTAWAVYAEGLPSAATGSLLEVKYILHLEGSPRLAPGTGSNGQMVPAATNKSHVNPVGHLATLQKVLQSPWVKNVASIGMSAVTGVVKKGAREAGLASLAALGLSI